MKRILVLIIVPLLLAGCGYDNFDEPESVLSGTVVYNNSAVGVRSNATQLELWQIGGYTGADEISAKIPVYINYDGTFRAVLFNGNYKILRMNGAPWENTADSVMITVSGDQKVDVPVTPYFVPTSVSYTKAATTVTATFTVQQVSETATLESASLFLNDRLITDHLYNKAVQTTNAAGITLGQQVSITVDIPEGLQSAAYLYVRVGVKATNSGERYYSPTEKVQ
jgi:hypothetical protein